MEEDLEDYPETISNEEDKDNIDYEPSADVGEKYTDKAILDLLLDTEITLKNLQRNMEGKELINNQWMQTRLPIARDTVIAFVINSLRTIINPSNSFSYIEKEQAKMSIYEKILEFEYMAVEEITIENCDFESLINMCDHALELFYGKVIDGHLTNALENIYAGTKTPLERPKEESLFSLKNMLGKN